MKKYFFAVLFVLVMTVPTMATTNINIDNLNQDDFRSFSKDFGMAASYIPLASAAALGDKLPGFDAGVEASYFKLDTSKQYFQKMNNFITPTGEIANLPSEYLIPRVHVQVGIPFIPIDFGVSYSEVPSSGGIKLVGYEVKWAILNGGLITPSVAIRGAYTKLSGVDAMDLSTKSLDLSISKGILIFTPYAGVGEVWITSTPHVENSTVPLNNRPQKEDIMKSKGYVGTKIKVFPFINIVLEGDFSNINEYSARLNVNF